MDLTRIPHDLDRRAHTARAVIEASRGARAKFAYDPRIEAFELSHLLPEGMAFPLDFGFVPSTLGEDGDPLDVMVLADQPLPTGVVAKVRLIGVIEGEQTEDARTVRNDRILGVAEKSILFARVRRVDELGPDFVPHLTNFWTTYNRLRGRRYEVIGVKQAGAAESLIRARPASRTAATPMRPSR